MSGSPEELCNNVTDHPSTASVGLPASYYSMWQWHLITFAL